MTCNPFKLVCCQATEAITICQIDSGDKASMKTTRPLRLNSPIIAPCTCHFSYYNHTSTQIIRRLTTTFLPVSFKQFGFGA